MENENKTLATFTEAGGIVAEETLVETRDIREKQIEDYHMRVRFYCFLSPR